MFCCAAASVPAVNHHREVCGIRLEGGDVLEHAPRWAQPMLMKADHGVLADPNITPARGGACDDVAGDLAGWGGVDARGWMRAYTAASSSPIDAKGSSSSTSLPLMSPPSLPSSLSLSTPTDPQLQFCVANAGYTENQVACKQRLSASERHGSHAWEGGSEGGRVPPPLQEQTHSCSFPLRTQDTQKSR